MTRILRVFCIGLAAAVFGGIGETQAEPFQYAVRLTVSNTGNPEQGLIAAADISSGDAFTMTLWIDPFVEQTGTNGGAAVFSNNVLLSLTAAKDGGNAGTFVPEIIGYTSAAWVSAAEDPDITVLQIEVSLQSGSLVNYTAWQAGIYNDEGVSPFSGIGFIFYLDTPFVNTGIGSALGGYFPGREDEVSLDAAAMYFDPGNSVPPMAATGTTTAVPEPSTVMLLGLGGVVLAGWARRGRARRG